MIDLAREWRVERMLHVLADAVDGDLEPDAPAFTGATPPEPNNPYADSQAARELPGLPKERNFHGVSLAVAHVTGMAAALLAEGVAKSELTDRLARGSKTFT